MSLDLSDVSLLIVTPARNEALNIPKVAASLRLQEYLPELSWIIVDDGSTDGTAEIAKKLELPFEVEIISRQKEGLLITGAAYSAWWQGVNLGLSQKPLTRFVMKLDADVDLDKGYFREIFAVIRNVKDGVFGGVISDLHREQKVYVPGPVKMYSRSALEELRVLPIATGFDVMDEVFLRQKGFPVSIVNSAKFKMNRQIGHSQGMLHGRFRNGLVCKWVGYDPLYFLFHLLRYCFRKPYFIGSIWMFWGYATSNNGPYPQYLRRAHARMQRKKLFKITKHPIMTLKELYF